MCDKYYYLMLVPTLVVLYRKLADTTSNVSSQSVEQTNVKLN
ncbi:hypothetical protein VCRA2121O157_160048 [Vibrio crassostreae]|nr:hypothetical protein VCRA2113O138_150065 [Vibrio crassostreae]CAK1788737.1 hypothetical protein VCRA2113O140_160049 [Vibrio crassostreae]CAK1839720.1 hypothetical protein VCRA2113O137_190047 [Vibrio crassostreae]CAK2644787.1 hypothetical protein VCRA2119O148_150065 [Vibrio crassostreae]CAK2662576.1 hypothetical protein VCRA2113O139_160067 [Vibrio crassostreae]